MVPQHTSIVVFYITPFSPVIASVDANMSNTGNNNRNNFHLSVDTSQQLAFCTCHNFDVSRAVLSCRTCRRQPTPQVVDAQVRHNKQAIQERDHANDQYKVAVAKLKEARATISQREATISQREATIKVVIAERDMYYGHAVRAHAQAKAANSDRDRVINDRDRVIDELAAANARIKQLEKQLAMRGQWA
jgi:hypothetical protein